MDAEEKDKILDILCQCGTAIKEGISFEMNFTKADHHRAAVRIKDMTFLTSEKYRVALELVQDIRESCRDMKKTYKSFLGKVKDYTTTVGRAFKRHLTSEVLNWSTKGKELARLSAQFTVEKKCLDEAIENDANTVKVSDWIREDKDPEPSLADLKRSSMPDGRHGDAGQWLLQGEAFRKWCGTFHVTPAQSCSTDGNNPPGEPPKRVLWLKGGLGTGKTTLMYHTYNHLKDNPDIAPIGKILRVIPYFCDSTKTEQTSSTTPVTILRALASRMAILPDLSLAPIAQKRHHQFPSPQDSSRQLDVDQVKELLKEMINDRHEMDHLVFLVDALDECKGGRAEDFLGFFSEVIEAYENISLICSSHQHVPVADFFETSNRTPGINTLQSIDVTEAQTKEDLARYIDVELERREKRASKSIFCKYKAHKQR